MCKLSLGLYILSSIYNVTLVIEGNLDTYILYNIDFPNTDITHIINQDIQCDLGELKSLEIITDELIDIDVDFIQYEFRDYNGDMFYSKYFQYKSNNDCCLYNLHFDMDCNSEGCILYTSTPTPTPTLSPTTTTTLSPTPTPTLSPTTTTTLSPTSPPIYKSNTPKFNLSLIFILVLLILLFN